MKGWGCKKSKVNVAVAGDHRKYYCSVSRMEEEMRVHSGGVGSLLPRRKYEFFQEHVTP